jgi:hypothetical protein
MRATPPSAAKATRAILNLMDISFFEISPKIAERVARSLVAKSESAGFRFKLAEVPFSRRSPGDVASPHRESGTTQGRLEHGVIRWNRHHALALCLSMIFSENRFPLFRIML